MTSEIGTDREKNIGESKGGASDVSTQGPNSFNFMQFSGKLGKIECWRPHLKEILDPPLKDDIRHQRIDPMN